MDIESIQLYKGIPYLAGKKIRITTPPMNVPFGLEDAYGKLQIKLRFHSLKRLSDLTAEEREMQQFYRTLQELEARLDTLGAGVNYHSNIKQSGKYDPLLILKVTEETPFESDGSVYHISELQPKDTVQVVFELGKMWEFKRKTGTLFIVNKVIRVR